DPAAAEPHLRRAYESWDEIGEAISGQWAALDLARSLLERGEIDEAEQLARRVEELAAPGNRPPQVGWRGVRARTLARRGELDAAEAVAREGLALADGSDWLELQGDARVDLAQVLEAAGKTEEAAALLRAAVELFDRKEDVLSARRTRGRLVQISERGPART